MIVLWLFLSLWVLSPPVSAQNIPRVTITTPTTATSYTTSTTPLLVGGTARDNRGITQVRWANDRGGSGIAQGTTTWTASIALQAGTNHLTVTARDAEGHEGTGLLTVTLTAPPAPPGPITVEWTYTGGGDAFQMERCVAPQPCSMAPVATIAMQDRSWVDTGVLSSQNYCYRMAVTTAGSVGPYSNTLCSP